MPTQLPLATERQKMLNFNHLTPQRDITLCRVSQLLLNSFISKKVKRKYRYQKHDIYARILDPPPVLYFVGDWVTTPHSFHWPCSMYRGWLTATPHSFHWPCSMYCGWLTATPHSFHWPCIIFCGWLTATPYWPCTCPVGPALWPMSAGWSRPARWGSHRTPLLG